MPNLFEVLKAFIIGVLVSVGVATTPEAPVPVASIQPTSKPAVSTPLPSVIFSNPPATAISLPDSPSPTNTPLALNGDNYLYVQGTYSYLGQSIKYLFLVPRLGGGFSGSIEGACNGSVGGEYEGGNGGRIYGKVSGTCNFLFIRYQGSTGFNGKLYPDSKKIEVEIDNSPLGSQLTINYD